MDVENCIDYFSFAVFGSYPAVLGALSSTCHFHEEDCSRTVVMYILGTCVFFFLL